MTTPELKGYLLRCEDGNAWAREFVSLQVIEQSRFNILPVIAQRVAHEACRRGAVARQLEWDIIPVHAAW